MHVTRDDLAKLDRFCGNSTTQPDFTNLYARKNENKNGPPHSTPLPVVVSMSSPIGCPMSLLITIIDLQNNLQKIQSPKPQRKRSD